MYIFEEPIWINESDGGHLVIESTGPDKGDKAVWYQVTRYARVFRGLTIGKRTFGNLVRRG